LSLPPANGAFPALWLRLMAAESFCNKRLLQMPCRWHGEMGSQ